MQSTRYIVTSCHGNDDGPRFPPPTGKIRLGCEVTSNRGPAFICYIALYPRRLRCRRLFEGGVYSYVVGKNEGGRVGQRVKGLHVPLT